VAALRFISESALWAGDSRGSWFQVREDRPPSICSGPSGLTSAPDVAQAIASAEPAFYHYGLLKDALARLRRLARRPDFVELSPPPPKLKIGELILRAGLRRMLSKIGDLPPGDATAPTDPTLMQT